MNTSPGHIDSAAVPCPVCGSPMVRVTSHDQCDRCGFILPCCDGDFPDACNVAAPEKIVTMRRITKPADGGMENASHIGREPKRF